MVDKDKAAKKLAECMDYPWDHMPEEGRNNMRKHAQAIVVAALEASKQEAPSDSTLKLAEMILSDCGHSTAISTRLRDRVAERIERHIAPQPTASNAGEREDDPTADELETFRRKHWTHWNAAENLLIAHLVQQLRSAALASKPPAGEQKPVGVVVEQTQPWPNDGATFNAVDWHDDVGPKPGTLVYTAPQPEQVAQGSVPADILKYAKGMQKQGYSGPLMWASKIIDWVVEQGAARARGEGGAKG